MFVKEFHVCEMNEKCMFEIERSWTVIKIVRSVFLMQVDFGNVKFTAVMLSDFYKISFQSNAKNSHRFNYIKRK